LNTLTKSVAVRVSPIENIIIIKRGIIRDLKPINNSGNIRAIMENRIAHNGKNLVIILFKKAPFTVNKQFEKYQFLFANYFHIKNR